MEPENCLSVYFRCVIDGYLIEALAGRLSTTVPVYYLHARNLDMSHDRMTPSFDVDCHLPWLTTHNFESWSRDLFKGSGALENLFAVLVASEIRVAHRLADGLDLTFTC